MSEPLTQEQERVFVCIQDFLDKHGYPPAIRQIQEALGYKSSSTIHQFLKVLQRKGWLEIEPHSPRALRVVNG